MKTKILYNKISSRIGVVMIFIVSILLLLDSCKKDNTTYTSVATINVINAAVNVSAIKLNMGGTPFYYSAATAVNYGAAALFYAKGQTSFKVVNSADTTTLLTNTTINFQPGVYSVYLAGQAPNIDTLIRQESNYPYIHNDVNSVDSSFNIRYVNLSPNSSPISVNIKNSTTNEVANLSYKGITSFKNYSANYKNTSYILEVRDAASNSLLSTVTLASNTYRFKNVVVLIKGLEGTTTGANAFSATALTFF